MAIERREQGSPDETVRLMVYRDAEGNRVENPAAAVRGEIVEPTDTGHSERRWFRVEEVELPWLRVSETAFLLWVFALLVLVWLVVALLLHLV